MTILQESTIKLAKIKKYKQNLTQENLINWLQLKHNIFISIKPVLDEDELKFTCTIYQLNKTLNKFNLKYKHMISKYDTYEEAIEHSIVFGLHLIS